MIPQSDERPVAGQFYLDISVHAEKRMKQRGISRDRLLVALMYGHRVYGRGCTFIHLRRCDLPAELDREADRYDGIVLWSSGARS